MNKVIDCAHKANLQFLEFNQLSAVFCLAGIPGFDSIGNIKKVGIK